jgi:predicted nucleic acid-binding protein
MIFNNKILCDADFLIGLFLDDDSNHQKSIDIYKEYSETHDFVVLNLTKYEFATVLSRKLPQALAIEINKLFLETFTGEVYFEKSWETETYKLYNSFQKKNISFFDCACLHYAKMVKAKIASFDTFYSAEILV